MKRLIKRIKTLYWFWKFTREYPDKFCIEVCDNPYKMTCWTPFKIFGVEKNDGLVIRK